MVYDGIIKPDSTIFGEESISGELYAGTLTLFRYQFTSGKTVDEYVGKLYRS